jgi:hypothetical protein
MYPFFWIVFMLFSLLGHGCMVDLLDGFSTVSVDMDLTERVGWEHRIDAIDSSKILFNSMLIKGFQLPSISAWNGIRLQR